MTIPSLATRIRVTRALFTILITYLSTILGAAVGDHNSSTIIRIY